MNTHSSLVFCLPVAVTLLGPTALLAQGPLAPPPGVPAPTMKTLAQVEPRFPVASAPVTLNQPGSYYLTTNLMGTVTVSSDNVTLDLMGFTVAPPAGHNGIVLSGAGKSFRVCNGVVALAGSDSAGITTAGVSGNLNARIEAVRVAGGGRYGIYVASGCTVEGCEVTGADTGIRVSGNSVVRACRFEGNVTGMRLTGTGAWVEGNVVRGNTSNYNIASGNRLNLLLCEVPETLAWPCSVKFAGTLTCAQNGVHGITVSADDVTIDMAGHALVGPGVGSWSGICQSPGTRNLRIMNGAVSYWVGQYGINLMGTAGAVSDVCAATNHYGFLADTDATFTRCVARGNKGRGFYANDRCVFTECVATFNGEEGFMACYDMMITDCLASENVSAGIAVFGDTTISGCTARRNGIGIYAPGPCVTMRGCVASQNRGHGLGDQSSGVISECAAVDNGGCGILAGASTVIVGCSSGWNGDIGFVLGPSCRLSDCQSRGNTSYGFFTGEKGASLSGCSAYDNLGPGIYLGDEATVSECAVADNASSGITVGPGSRVAGSQVLRNGDDGIQASEGSTVAECTVFRNARTGVVAGRDSTVAGCTVSSNGTGIAVEFSSKVSGCAAHRNRGVGIVAWAGGSILDCAAEYNQSNGVEVAGSTVVMRCVANNNGSGGNGAGFLATGMGNRFESNQAIGNDKGFVAWQGANFIFRNIARWNSPNWSIASGNLCLVVMGTAAGAINGDSGGVSPGSTDPNANFTY